MIPVKRLKQTFISQWHNCPETAYNFQNKIPQKYIKNNFSTFLKTQIAAKEIPANMEKLKSKVMPEMRTFAEKYLLLPGLDTDADQS